MLLLGKSVKSSDSRGQFGEGMKLAMMVLSRMDRRIVVYTSKEKWLPSIAPSEIFGEDTFGVEVISKKKQECAGRNRSDSQ